MFETNESYEVRPDGDAVRAEAAAVREHELELRNSDNFRIEQVNKMEMEMRRRADRRTGTRYVLTGLLALAIVLAIVAAIWTYARGQQSADLKREQARQQTAQECIRQGGIWLAATGCLPTKVGVPAPAAS